MRICDFSREDEVVAQVAIEFTLPDGRADESLPHAFELDLGKAALDAIVAQDWQALAELVPANLRKTNSKRSEGAKRAAVTRRANREKNQTTLHDQVTPATGTLSFPGEGEGVDAPTRAVPVPVLD